MSKMQAWWEKETTLIYNLRHACREVDDLYDEIEKEMRLPESVVKLRGKVYQVMDYIQRYKNYEKKSD